MRAEPTEDGIGDQLQHWVELGMQFGKGRWELCSGRYCRAAGLNVGYSAMLSLSLSQGKSVAVVVGSRLGIVKCQLLWKAIEPS